MRLRVFAALASAALIFLCGNASAQDRGYEVFVPISKYLAHGDSDKLSAWFADNLEITIFSSTSDCSRNQASQLLRSFFKSYTPRDFEKIGRAHV